MSFLINFFKSVITFAQKFIDFVFSIPGILLGIVVGLAQGISWIADLWTSQGEMVTTVQGMLNNHDLNTIVSNGGTWLQVAVYACSIDLLLRAIGAVIGWIVMMVTMIVAWTVDAFLPIVISLIAWKIFVKLFKRFVPSNYLPEFDIDAPSLDWVPGVDTEGNVT